MRISHGLSVLTLAFSLPLIAGCGLFAGNPLKDAYDACLQEGIGDGVRPDDSFEGLTFDTQYATDGMDDTVFIAVDCITSELGTPDYMLDEMTSTTAMMGRQRESEDGLDYAWSYHPDNGFTLTISK